MLTEKTKNQEMMDIIQTMVAMWRRRNIADNPDGDWDPLFIVQAKTGEMHVPPIDTRMMEHPDAKQALALVIAGIVSHEMVERAGLMFSGWQLKVPPNADGSPVDYLDRPRPSESPDREEILTAHVVDQDGEMSSSALITRHHDRGPTVGLWESRDDCETSGLFPDALRCVRDQRSIVSIIAELLG